MSQLLQFYKSFQQARSPAAKPPPTFEDLTIDDKLNEHQRVVKYTKSTIGLQRLVHVKMIADVAQTIGFRETVTTIMPLLEPLSKDNEPVVKQHLVEQLKLLAKFFHSEGNEEGYKLLLEKILPLTAVLLEDEKQEVRHAACMAMVEVAQLVKLDDIGQYVLTIILRLAHEDDKEEMRMTAAQLLNLLAESMGQDLCRQFIIPEVVSLAEDPVFRVRKSTALNFHNICKVGGEHELLERLMPAFVRLSKDEMYRVRRACAESLSEIAKHVHEDIRLGVLVEIFLRLAHDPSKLVKQSILQQSGMFIATLPARAVNETVLGQYCSMVLNPTGDAGADAELRHICAYSFPAVLQVIGKERWKEIRELYHSLAQSRSNSIKQTLACSLHEIASMLDNEELVEEELVPVFEDLIQDAEFVQMGVIKHIACFLRCLPHLCRVSYLPILHDIVHSTNPFNWRLRQFLANQLPQLAAIPDKPDVYRTLFPTVMTLLQDPVAGVRNDTFKGVAAMLNALYDVVHGTNYAKSEVVTNVKNYPTEVQQTAATHLEEAIATINTFMTNDKCYLRQLYMELCIQLLKDIPTALFEEYFLPGVLLLTVDPVFNVRYSVARFFAGWAPDLSNPWEEYIDGKVHPWAWLLSRADAKHCVERLSRDDLDVCLNVHRLQPVYPDITFDVVKCRGRKTAPGGITPIMKDGTLVFSPIDIIKIVRQNVNQLGGDNTSSSMNGNGSSASSVNGDDMSFHRHRSGSNVSSTDNNSNNNTNSTTLDEMSRLLPRLSLTDDDDDDYRPPVDLHAVEVQLTTETTITDSTQLTNGDGTIDNTTSSTGSLVLAPMKEREIVSNTTLLHPEILEELDVIDGILPSMTFSRSKDAFDEEQNSAERQRRNSFGLGIQHAHQVAFLNSQNSSQQYLNNSQNNSLDNILLDNSNNENDSSSSSS